MAIYGYVWKKNGYAQVNWESTWWHWMLSNARIMRTSLRRSNSRFALLATHRLSLQSEWHQSRQAVVSSTGSRSICREFSHAVAQVSTNVVFCDAYDGSSLVKSVKQVCPTCVAVQVDRASNNVAAAVAAGGYCTNAPNNLRNVLPHSALPSVTMTTQCSTNTCA